MERFGGRLFPHPSCYIVLAGVILFNLVALAATDASIDVAQLGIHVALLAPFVIFPLAVERVPFSSPTIERVCRRAAGIALGLFFLQLGWLNIRLANHLSMKLTASTPYFDDWLARLDALVLADWPAYLAAVQSNGLAVFALGFSYTSLTVLSVAAFLLLALLGNDRRTRFFVEAFFYTALVCTFAGMFFPALGAAHRHIGTAGELAGFLEPPGLWAVAAMEAVRGSEAVRLDLANLPGLVTFPSFHTAAAVVMGASFWCHRLFVPVAIYAAIVIAATPVFGGHYFADLASGGAVAAIVLAILARQARFAGLFARQARQGRETQSGKEALTT